MHTSGLTVFFRHYWPPIMMFWVSEPMCFLFQKVGLGRCLEDFLKWISWSLVDNPDDSFLRPLLRKQNGRGSEPLVGQCMVTKTFQGTAKNTPKRCHHAPRINTPPKRWVASSSISKNCTRRMRATSKRGEPTNVTSVLQSLLHQLFLLTFLFTWM